MSDDPAPLIYAPHPYSTPVRLTVIGRCYALGVAAACLGVLVTAATITPSPTGTGSHTQLGLEPCQFLARTGVPAPSCGMTTSFAWFVRGNVLASLYVQPMDTALAALSATAVLVGIYVAWTARPVYRLLYLLPAPRIYVPLLVHAIVAWAWKIFIHRAGLDGWR